MIFDTDPHTLTDQEIIDAMPKVDWQKMMPDQIRNGLFSIFTMLHPKEAIARRRLEMTKNG